MNSEIPHPEPPDAKSWEAVGGYLRESLVEVSNELGGQELAETIIEIADTPEVIPDAHALSYLEYLYPGAVREVLDRAEQIQETRLKREKRGFISRFFKNR